MTDARDLRLVYRESLRLHGYRADPSQEHAVARLDDLRSRLEKTGKGETRGLLGRLLGRPGACSQSRTAVASTFGAASGAARRS